VTAELYRSSKTYDHNEGLSCCFRQWPAAHSHCRLLHGYALGFHFAFATRTLDRNNWCLDFGAMKPVRAWLHDMFDHTVLIAADDPHRGEFERLATMDLIDIRIVPAVGCEAIARQAFDYVSVFAANQTEGRVWLERVEVREHAGNAASYERLQPDR